VFTPAGISSVQGHRWQVQNRDHTSSIVVTNNFLAVQTSSYSVFEEFLKELRLGVESVASEVEGLVVERIGLRYINLIRPPESQAWKDYLRPGLHGLQSKHLSERSQANLYQSVGQSEHGTMIVRMFQNREGAILPPDLLDSDLQLNVDPPLRSSELLTVVDLDHFAARQLDFETSEIEKQVWALHDAIDHVFREEIVTSAALKEWA
jgi:uncharacterized protein (TIGR04255 family)